MIHILLPRVPPEVIVAPDQLLFLQNMGIIFLNIIQLRLKRFDLRLQSSHFWVNRNTRVNFKRRNWTTIGLKIIDSGLLWIALNVEIAAGQWLDMLKIFVPYLRSFLDLRIYVFFVSWTGLFNAQILNFLHSIYYKISKSLPIEEYRLYLILIRPQIF